MIDIIIMIELILLVPAIIAYIISQKSVAKKNWQRITGSVVAIYAAQVYASVLMCICYFTFYKVIAEPVPNGGLIFIGFSMMLGMILISMASYIAMDVILSINKGIHKIRYIDYLNERYGESDELGDYIRDKGPLQCLKETNDKKLKAFIIQVMWTV